jgi:hypothetical protein
MIRATSNRQKSTKSQKSDTQNLSMNKSNVTKILNKSKNDYSGISGRRDTMIDQITEESIIFFDDNEKTRVRTLLDKIIKGYNSTKNEKNYGIDEDVIEKDLYSKLDLTRKKYFERNLNSQEEENVDYELVEKSYYENMLKENEELNKYTKKLTTEMSDLKNGLYKTQGKCYLYKHLSDTQEKLKSDNVKRTKELENEILIAKGISKSLKVKYSKDGIDLDNLLKAILNLTEKYTKKENGKNIVLDEFKRIYNVLNNEYFLSNYKSPDEDNIENLIGKIHSLRKQIEAKDFEYYNLIKIVNIQKKQKN